MQPYLFVKNCKNNEVLRNSFFDLGEEIFSLNLRTWHENNCWKDDYIPYSFAKNGVIIANASANLMKFCLNDGIKHYIQIGTVMTHPDYRNRGLATMLIEKILADYKGADGFYLFANENAVNFYPKLGFYKTKEYLYRQNNVACGGLAAEKYDDLRHKERLLHILQHRKTFCKLQMQDNIGLTTFHINSMKPYIYYVSPLNAFFIAETKGSTLTLYDVFSDNRMRESDLLPYFPANVDTIEYGYAPNDISQSTLKNDGDDVLFTKGNFDEFIKEKLCFPLLTHA